MKKNYIIGVAVLIMTACSSIIKTSSNACVDVEIPEWIEKRMMQKVKIYNLPVHYTEEILCGDGCVCCFRYPDSSVVFFCEKAEESPNMENIRKQKTIPARWRSYGWLDGEYKEWVLHQLDNDSIRSKLLSVYWEDYQCTTLDIFNGEPDSSIFLNLRGIDEKNRYWRDVKVNDFCFGYFGVSLAKLSEFDRCINATLLGVNMD